MKKLLVVAVILIASYACGQQSAATSAGRNQPLSLSNGTSQGAPDKSATTVPGQTSFAPQQPAPTPIQGPLVIRQAQLTVSVGSGSFDSKLTDVRHLVEL